MRASRLAVITLVGCLFGCADSASTGDPGPLLREARIDLEIGSADGDGPDVFGRIGGLLELDDGRILVSDMLANEIRVFGPDGSYRFRFGREGEGPGELAGPCCLAPGPDGLVWVRETGNGRYSAFRVHDDQAEYVRGVIQQHGAAGLMAPTTFDAEGRLVDVGARPAEEGGYEHARFVMDAEGAVAATETAVPAALTELGSHAVQGTINGQPARVFLWQPFASRAISAHGPEGRRALGTSGTYEIEARHGARLDTLRGEVQRGPALSECEREAGREAMERDAGRVGLSASDLPYGIPDRRTPLNELYYDAQGRLWVELSVPADSARVAEIWDTEGRRAGRVRWPSDVRLGTVSWIGEGRALGVRTDDLGVQRVVRLRWDGFTNGEERRNGGRQDSSP